MNWLIGVGIYHPTALDYCLSRVLVQGVKSADKKRVNYVNEVCRTPWLRQGFVTISWVPLSPTLRTSHLLSLVQYSHNVWLSKYFAQILTKLSLKMKATFIKRFWLLIVTVLNFTIVSTLEHFFFTKL